MAVDGVPVRNAASVGNVITPPVDVLKLLFRKRRNSPPNLNEWRPRIHDRVSLYWNAVSPRPCGNPSIPPNLITPETLIFGKSVEPVVSPKSAGLYLPKTSGRNWILTRFAPARNSLVSVGLNTCV